MGMFFRHFVLSTQFDIAKDWIDRVGKNNLQGG